MRRMPERGWYEEMDPEAEDHEAHYLDGTPKTDTIYGIKVTGRESVCGELFLYGDADLVSRKPAGACKRCAAILKALRSKKREGN